MAYINQQSAHFLSDNIIETMGGDFTYMDANVYFKNLDKLIRWENVCFQGRRCSMQMLLDTNSNYLSLKSDVLLLSSPVVFDAKSKPLHFS